MWRVRFFTLRGNGFLFGDERVGRGGGSRGRVFGEEDGGGMGRSRAVSIGEEGFLLNGAR